MRSWSASALPAEAMAASAAACISSTAFGVSRAGRSVIGGPLAERRPGHFEDGVEACGVTDCDVSQYFAVKCDPGFFQSLHEMAVREAAFTRGGV